MTFRLSVRTLPRPSKVGSRYSRSHSSVSTFFHYRIAVNGKFVIHTIWTPDRNTQTMFNGNMKTHSLGHSLWFLTVPRSPSHLPHLCAHNELSPGRGESPTLSLHGYLGRTRTARARKCSRACEDWVYICWLSTDFAHAVL